MGFIILIAVFYIIPLGIIKLSNRYLHKHNKQTIFEDEFWLAFIICCIPLLNWGMVIWILLDVFDCMNYENKFEGFKKRITKWMS